MTDNTTFTKLLQKSGNRTHGFKLITKDCSIFEGFKSEKIGKIGITSDKIQKIGKIGSITSDKM